MGHELGDPEMEEFIAMVVECGWTRPAVEQVLAVQQLTDDEFAPMLAGTDWRMRPLRRVPSTPARTLTSHVAVRLGPRRPIYVPGLARAGQEHRSKRCVT